MCFGNLERSSRAGKHDAEGENRKMEKKKKPNMTLQKIPQLWSRFLCFLKRKKKPGLPHKSGCRLKWWIPKRSRQRKPSEDDGSVQEAAERRAPQLWHRFLRTLKGAGTIEPVSSSRYANRDLFRCFGLPDFQDLDFYLRILATFLTPGYEDVGWWVGLATLQLTT